MSIGWFGTSSAFQFRKVAANKQRLLTENAVRRGVARAPDLWAGERHQNGDETHSREAQAKTCAILRSTEQRDPLFRGHRLDWDQRIGGRGGVGGVPRPPREGRGPR